MSDINIKRHSYSHILAEAVLQMFPEAKLAIGPAIDNGFYYDFELPRTLIPEDLPLIEEKMRAIINEGRVFEKYEEPTDKAIEFLKKANQTYKIELVEDLIKEEKIKEVNFYKTGEHFVDMCKGPHVENTSELDVHAFKLDKISGAYWKGDEKRVMLQRIYGLAFDTKEELDKYLIFREEEAKRDHRKLNKELEIFSICDEVGAGLIMWLPNGAIIRHELEKLAYETEFSNGYKHVATPHITKEDLYIKSGHLPYYKDDMFPPLELDKEKYYLRPMNCPHHHLIYSHKPRSYRELPLRLSEYGSVYRYEKSGELGGLFRVRGMCMNDAHIYVTPEQIKEEFIRVINMHKYYYDLLGIEKARYRLSLHSKEGLGKKYVDNEPAWIESEEKIRQAMKEANLDFYEAEDEAAFYGPKIDINIYNAIGKEYAIGTTQLDFAVPPRFDLKFIDKDGKERMPYCIHRAPLSTHERFIGFLIEHFAGAFPTWLAPVQVALLPVATPHVEYIEKLKEELEKFMIRCEVFEPERDTLGKRIRETEMKKIPYMVVIGDKEMNGDISVRSYKTKEQKVISKEEFITGLVEEIKERRI